MFVLIDDLLLASILLCPGDPAVNAPRFIGLPVGAIVNDVQIVDFILGVCKIFSVIGRSLCENYVESTLIQSEKL